MISYKVPLLLNFTVHTDIFSDFWRKLLKSPPQSPISRPSPFGKVVAPKHHNLPMSRPLNIPIPQCRHSVGIYSINSSWRKWWCCGECLDQTVWCHPLQVTMWLNQCNGSPRRSGEHSLRPNSLDFCWTTLPQKAHTHTQHCHMKHDIKSLKKPLTWIQHTPQVTRLPMKRDVKP